MMKNALAALVIALASAMPTVAQRPATPARALAASPDPDTLVIAREVVDLAFPPAGRPALLARAGDTMVAQVRSASVPPGAAPDPGAMAIIDRYMERARALTERVTTEHSDAIFAAFVRAYARQFTRDELVQIRAFVATPAGAHYVQRSADLLSDPDVAAANTTYMRSVIAAVDPLRAQLRDELVQHFAHRRR